MAGFKRAISPRVVEQSKFLKLTATQQILYMQLVLHADDEGIAEGRMSCLLCKADDEELQALEDAKLIKILNDDPVIYILDWEEHTIIRSDRIVPSVYHDLLVEVIGSESKSNSDDNLTQPVDKMTQTAEDEENSSESDNSLSDKELAENDNNACHSDKDLTQFDNICPQNDKTCPQNDAPYHTIPYNTSNQEKKKNSKEKREIQISIKSCNNALSRSFGYSNLEIAGLLLEWMRDKDTSTLETWVKRAKELSNGKLDDAKEIIGKSVRCSYKDFYPLQPQERSNPGTSFSQNSTNSIAKDKTDQYKNVHDESISF